MQLIPDLDTAVSHFDIGVIRTRGGRIHVPQTDASLIIVLRLVARSGAVEHDKRVGDQIFAQHIQDIVRDFG